MTNSQIEEIAVEEFFSFLEHIAYLKFSKDKTKSNLETIKFFDRISERVTMISKAKSIGEEEYFKWIFYCYCNRKKDRSVDDWNIFEAFHYVILFDLEELQESEINSEIDNYLKSLNISFSEK